MFNHKKTLSIKARLAGISAASVILAVLGMAMGSLCLFAVNAGDLNLYFDAYLRHIMWVTFWQACLSTSLSIVFALLVAKSLSQVNFKGKLLLLKIMPVTFILPSLVVVTGLLSVYGQHGMLASLCKMMNLPFSFSIYGITGILLAHLFLNFPYATKLFYQILMSIPTEQRQLAAQLNFSRFTFFTLVEWPLLRRQIMPLAALIFMLCFTSFAVVLALGGGPKYTTLEVAIYQAIRDFELLQAVMLSILQLVCCAFFIWFSRRISHGQRVKSQFTLSTDFLITPFYLKWLAMLIILIACFFILSPIVSIFIEGLLNFKFVLFNAFLGQVIGNSLLIAFGSAVISLLLGTLLLWTNSRLLMYQHIHSSHRLMLIGSLMLAIPSMVLASGLYLWLFEYANNRLFVCLLIMVCNSLMALPFVLKNLEMPMYDVAQRYQQMSTMLNITGIKHFYLIEFKALKKQFVMSFAFAAILSLGDFGIIALFGGQAVQTLPYYLYEQISHYHYQDGAVTALILLLLSLALLLVIDNAKLAKNER